MSLGFNIKMTYLKSQKPISRFLESPVDWLMTARKKFSMQGDRSNCDEGV
jgi:hypothetical protein